MRIWVGTGKHAAAAAGAGILIGGPSQGMCTGGEGVRVYPTGRSSSSGGMVVSQLFRVPKAGRL